MEIGIEEMLILRDSEKQLKCYLSLDIQVGEDYSSYGLILGSFTKVEPNEEGSISIQGVTYSPVTGEGHSTGIYVIFIGDFPMIDTSPIIKRISLYYNPIVKEERMSKILGFIPSELVLDCGRQLGVEHVDQFRLVFMSGLPITLYINTNYE